MRSSKKGEKNYCERCGDEILPGREIWLELSITDGKYYKTLPGGHESQGYFCFGKTCAGRINDDDIIGQDILINE